MFPAIPINVFEERTGIQKRDVAQLWDSAESIVSLRDIASIESIQAMPVEYLERLIRNVSLAGDPDKKIYKDSRIRRVRIDPHSLLIGQTFVERSKYRILLEKFTNFFSGFYVPRGVAKCTAYIVLGRMSDGTHAIAHYIPPIVENHNDELVLLDGIHRNFLVMAVGTTIETIVIQDIPREFPCDVQPWSRIRAVDEKPPKNERYFNLKPELFRDVKTIGIDG